MSSIWYLFSLCFLSPQYEELRETTGKHDSLRNTKNEIVELSRVIQRLTGEHENTKAQVRMTQEQ